MRVTLFNNHTPYAHALATALPDVDWEVLPTAHHAPCGWRPEQRPQPPNVRILERLDHPPDMMIAQTGADWDALARWSRWPRLLHLSHNRAEYEEPGLPQWLRETGTPLVCISEMKRQSWVAAGYHSVIHVIPPGIHSAQFEAWHGCGTYVLTVCNGLVHRPLFDVNAWLEATAGLDTVLVGEGNDGVRGAVGPAPSWEALRQHYQTARVYLSVNRWPFEDGYNLALLEAMAAGMPCVALENPSAPAWPGGYQGDTCNPGVLQAGTAPALRALLTDALEVPALARPWGEAAQALVRDCFPFAAFAASWRRVVQEVVHG